jgi:hypothetical protein
VKALKTLATAVQLNRTTSDRVKIARHQHKRLGNAIKKTVIRLQDFGERGLLQPDMVQALLTGFNFYFLAENFLAQLSLSCAVECPRKLLELRAEQMRWIAKVLEGDFDAPKPLAAYGIYPFCSVKRFVSEFCKWSATRRKLKVPRTSVLICLDKELGAPVEQMLTFLIETKGQTSWLQEYARWSGSGFPLATNLYCEGRLMRSLMKPLFKTKDTIIVWASNMNANMLCNLKEILVHEALHTIGAENRIPLINRKNRRSLPKAELKAFIQENPRFAKTLTIEIDN